MRKWLHDKFDVHHWMEWVTGGQMEKRRCQICGLVQWFNFLTSEWFDKGWE